MHNKLNNNILPRTERLRSHKVIARLFDRNSKEGYSFLVYPYRVVVLVENTPGPVEILISVPKRNFKKAVDRNRIKRLTRESYRLNKQEFPHKVILGLLYVGKHLPTFDETSKAMNAIIQKLQEK